MNQLHCSLPSQPQARQSIFWSWVDQQVRGLVGRWVQQALQYLQEEQLNAGWNQRVQGRRGYRNGFRKRQLTTTQGPVTIRVPRLRQGMLDHSAIFQRYQRRLVDVERVLRHAYLVGVSTRDAAELAKQIFGSSLSHQTISRLMHWLDKELTSWRSQPIAPVYSVVYVDGMHVNRVGGDRTIMLVVGCREGGCLEVLGFCVSTGESCTDLLTSLRRRGLEKVQLFVSDQSGAIRSALTWVYPEVSWQHCVFHRLAQLRAEIGLTDYRKQMVAEASCIFRCASREAAFDQADLWRQRWLPIAPVAVWQFMEGLSDSLRFYDIPKHWWKRVRTNNPLERLIRTLRHRLRPMGCFYDDTAIERALFGQLLRRHLVRLTHNA
jgi:transposase-like protein